MYPYFKARELKDKVDSGFPKVQEDVCYRAESSNLVFHVPGWKATPKCIWDCSGLFEIAWLGLNKLSETLRAISMAEWISVQSRLLSLISVGYIQEYRAVWEVVSYFQSN